MATFFEAQAHHRRAAARWAGLCLVAALTIAAGAAATLASAVLLMVVLAARIAGVDVWPADTRDAARWIGWTALPIAIVIVATWRRVRIGLRAETAAALVGELAAWPAREDDFEERQLLNIAGEMAIASGLAAPGVLVTAAADLNVAVVESSTGGACLIVARPVLETLDREQTQALVAHAMATVINGDARLYAEALALTRAQARVTRWCTWPLGAGFVRVLLLLPFALPALAGLLALGVMTLIVTVPLVGWMLRHRRYLADATAVQLTRYPEALASALDALDPLSRTRSGGHWAPQFFIVDAADPRFETPLVLFGVHPPVRDRRERILHFRNRIGLSEV